VIIELGLCPDRSRQVNHLPSGRGFGEGQAVERIGTTRRYQPATPAIRTLVALLILRGKVIKPVLADAGKPKPGRPPKRVHPLDVHYTNLQREMHHTLDTANWPIWRPIA
jgi:hypothetical protein